MAITKIDITMLEDVTGANNLVKLDANAKIPACSGASLSVKPGPTKSASDPAIDSNKSLGAEWLNTTDGEMFICTDATTDENVWTNVGAGTGDIIPWPSYTFQAENYGFTVGGSSPAIGWSNIIGRFSISAGGSSTDHGDLSAASGYGAGFNAETYGYVALGYLAPSPNYDAQVDKFAFASNVTSTNHCQLSVARSLVAASYNETHGYSAGGRISDPSASNVIDKFAFDSTSTATDWGDIGSVRYGGSPCSSATHGYHNTGQDGSDGYIQTIYKYPFASNAGSTGHGNLNISGGGKYGGAGASDISGGYGFHCAGSGGGYSKEINKYSLSSNTTASDHGDLSGNGRYGMGGISGASHGFILGGYQTGGGGNYIDKFAYASNTTATDVADMTVARSSNGANGY